MRFYRVSYTTDCGTSAGFSWHTSKRNAARDAAEAVRENPAEYADQGPDIEVVEIEPTRAGILAALRRYASHEQNG